MKKFIIMIFLAAITAAGAFCQDGIISGLTGNVELKHEGASAFITANAGDQVAFSTIISTGFRSVAILEIGSSMITVHPLTRLTVAEIQTGNAENVRLNLQSGKVRVEVHPPAGARASFSVQSPASVASVRGTSFEMDARTLTVSEGIVIYSGTSGSAVIVTGGNSSFINIDGTPADPAQTAEESLAPSSPIGAPATSRTSEIGVTVYGEYSNDN